MDPVEIDSLASTSVTEPVLIEGLPGVGLVGKLATDHLLADLDAEPVRRLYSTHFPPGIAVDENGTAELPSLTVHAIEADGQDLLILSGDSQAEDGPGHFALAEAVLDIATSFDVSRIVTVGGLGTGEQVEDYAVLGAVPESNDGLREPLEAAGVRFSRDEPGNTVGMSGVLLGLGDRRGIDTAGLLGTTPGYFVDPGSARAVLNVLAETFGLSIDLDTLDEQAEEVQELLDRLQQLQGAEQSPSSGGEDLRYIG
jgi:uncharacterized protein (TIGR00162 family)